MTKFVISNTVGKIKQNSRFEDWWESSKVALPLFKNTKCSITLLDFHPIADATFLQQTDEALSNFLNLSIDDRNNISDVVYNHCLECLQNNEPNDDGNQLEQFRKLKKSNEIWNFIKPSDIYVTRHTPADPDVYIQVICDSAWDKKNGLQLVYKQGYELTRVSFNDGYLTNEDALGISEDKEVHSSPLS